MLKLFQHRPQSLTQLTSRFSSGYSERERMSHISEEDREREAKARKLKSWKPEGREPDTFLSAFNVVSDRHGIFTHSMSLKLTDWMNWYKRHQLEYLRWSQKYNPDRQHALGNDLALATVLLYRGGKVKRKGIRKFMDKEDIPSLPTTYEPTWFLEEVDVSGTDICYEGLENFKDVHRLKKAYFRNCKHFDDWCLERVVCFCQNLEVLDISENEKITERGLEGLYRAWNLKKVIVTDWGYGAAFELTCLLLEEAMPDLTVEIRKPEKPQGIQGEELAGTSQKIESHSEGAGKKEQPPMQ